MRFPFILLSETIKELDLRVLGIDDSKHPVEAVVDWDEHDGSVPVVACANGLEDVRGGTIPRPHLVGKGRKAGNALRRLMAIGEQRQATVDDIVVDAFPEQQFL